MSNVAYVKNPYSLYLSGYSAHSHFLKHIGVNKTVLDVGCNDGYIGRLADKSNVFYGLDYSPESINKAKKTYKSTSVYDLNNLRKLPWDIKFDLMLFGDVLEHTLFPEKVLTYFVSKYLRKGGTVIISLPNVANWRIRIKLLLGNFDYTDSGILDRTHLHLYTFKSTREMIKKSRLEITEEIGSTKIFGPLIRLFPFSKGFFSINIIMICKK